MAVNPLTITLLVIDALEALNVPYLIGGSLASNLYGVVRATLDTDVVADLRPEHARPLVDALAKDFYVDLQAVDDAIRRRRCFNVIHLKTMFKVDVFVARHDAFTRDEFSRRNRLVVTDSPERAAYVASVEDTILAKLDWFQQGGGVSDRQWRDVLEMLKAYADRLDMEYLRRWAEECEVSSLLRKALQEADIAGNTQS